MKNRLLAALALLWLMPALALGEITVRSETTGDDVNRIVHFAPKAEDTAGARARFPRRSSSRRRR